MMNTKGCGKLYRHEFSGEVKTRDEWRCLSDLDATRLGLVYIGESKVEAVFGEWVSRQSNREAKARVRV